jgi:hypothetical protein
MLCDRVFHQPVKSRHRLAAVYAPKDFDLNAIMADIVAIVERGARRAA